jgi:probable HAF family extracellular repeat protein
MGRSNLVGVPAPGSDRIEADEVEGYQRTDLGTLGGWLSQADAINVRGQIVGHDQTAGGGNYGFLWFGGVMRSIRALWTPVRQGGKQAGGE